MFNLKLSEEKRNTYKEKLRQHYKDLPDDLLNEMIDYLLVLALWEAAL